MPDWLDSGFVQTIVLLVATSLAFLTFRAERDARRDAAAERRLEAVAARVAELAAATVKSAEVQGRGWEVMLAQRNLRSALALAPGELPKTQALPDVPGAQVAIGALVDEALQEVRSEVERLTNGARWWIGRKSR